jgi:hypothetical protein
VYDDYSRPLSTEQLRTVTGHVTVAGREAPLRMRRALEPLEADVRPASLPMEVAAHVRFTPDSPEYRFDFTYGRTATTESASAATNSSRAPASAPLADLRARIDEIRATIDRGAFAEIYVPAFAAKDLALTIAARDSRTNAVVARLVRAAWMLDAAADVGDRGQVRDAFTRLTQAVDELEARVK